jgi:hypothetical protein
MEADADSLQAKRDELRIIIGGHGRAKKGERVRLEALMTGG